MKKLLILGAIGLGIFYFTQKKDDQLEELETAFRELTDAEAQNYINQNVDLLEAFGTNLEKAKEHWRNWGWEKEFSIGGRQNPYLA